MTKIMSLDLLPETLFLLIFWLLVCTWMETFIRIKMWKSQIKKVFWWIFPVGAVVILLSMVVTIASSTSKKYTYTQTAQQGLSLQRKYQFCKNITILLLLLV
jgi:hypothetical protein